MSKENERKYLVKNDSWRHAAGPGISHRQGYLSLDEERSVRVRIAGDDAMITVKGKSRGSSRDEFEYRIPMDDARQMLDRLCVRPIIEKTRYEIHRDDLKWQVDEFGGDNRGLLMAEVETERADGEIDRPNWLGKEVTADSRYYNVNLVKHPYSQWEVPVQ